MDDHLNATHAKKEYFLTADDLRSIPHTRYRGWGAGSTKLYDTADLERASRRKHGSEGLADRRAKRARREEAKIRREAEAREAERIFLAGVGGDAEGPIDLTENADPNRAAGGGAAAVARRADPKEVERLRKEIRRALKPSVSWDFLRSKNSENGANATARLLRVDQIEYCALIGREADPDLRTLAKKGAWYSSTLSFANLLGPNAATLYGSGGRYNCNSDLGIDPDGTVTVKYSPSNKTLSVTAFVRHRDTFGYGDY